MTYYYCPTCKVDIVEENVEDDKGILSHTIKWKNGTSWYWTNHRVIKTIKSVKDK